jgi:hypothetical protein
MKPTRGRTEEIRLVNRLWSANVSQFWWTVSCAHDHGHVALMSLYDCAKKVCGCGSGSAQQDCRNLRRESDTQCSERRASFVMEKMDSDL